MTKIEYLNEVIYVPTNWGEIQLKHYENFYQEKPEAIRDRVAFVAKLCSIEPDKLLNQPVDVFNILVDQTAFIFQEFIAEPSAKIVIEGVTYVIPIEEKLSLGAYIDALETQKGGDRVISGILAIVCRPEGEAYDDDLTEARTTMFGELTMNNIWPVLAFFLKCNDALEKRTKAFTDLIRAVESLPPSILVFPRLGGGTKLSQMWQIIKYYYLTKLLRYRLRRLLRISNISGIKTTPTRRKGNWIGNLLN